MRALRVLLDHPNPFLLAHGGFQIQIEQTCAGLKQAGVDVDWLRWWDDRQTADVIHYFGRPPITYLHAAQRKGIKVVLAQLLTGLGSRPRSLVQLQALGTRLARTTLPFMISSRFAWDAFRLSDACIANTPWEAELMRTVFGAPPARVHVVPNGVEDVFLYSAPAERGKWLVCSATVTERKRVLELVEAAVLAETPLWVVGRPYATTDPYATRTLAFIQAHPKLLRYEGQISDRQALAKAYREARGFVLLSTMETRSLAAEEAAACECPLLLSDLPWARSVFGEYGTYISPKASNAKTAERLRAFYDAAPALPVPPKPITWLEVGRQLSRIYTDLVSTS